MDIMYLQQPGDTELSGGDTQDIRRPLIRPEAPKLRTQQSERWATTSQQQQQTHKQTQRTLYFYLFLSAGGQSQTRGASLLKIKLWNFDYHPAHSVIQHVRHTPPCINHMQSNKQPVRLQVKVDCEWLSPDLSVRQTTINKLKRSSRETQNISRTKVLSEKKKENNILISFVLKCAPISSYLHSSEAAAPVWIPAWKNFAASPTNSQRLYAPSRQHLRAGRRQTQMSLVRDSKPNLINSISTSKSNSLTPPAGTHNRLAVCRHVRPADRSPRR